MAQSDPQATSFAIDHWRAVDISGEWRKQMGNAQNKLAIAGVGYSKVGRHLPLPDDELVRQAVTAAMEDGGMTPSDIDGIATMGGNAMSIGGLLGIMPLNYFHTSPGGPAFVEPAIASIAAVASGMSHTCVA